jgi:acyl-CoA thioester hydrolase
MGVVYYANFFVWFEVGRTDLLRGAGSSYRDLEGQGYSLPVMEARCEYRRPARYDDELDIRTTGTLLSPVRVRFDYQVVRGADDTLLATGHTMHAALDAEGKPRRLPDHVSQLLLPGAGPAAEGDTTIGPGAGAPAGRGPATGRTR